MAAGAETQARVTAVIVTHNSQSAVVRHVIRALLDQTVQPEHIVIVDSGSATPSAIAELGSLSIRITVESHSNLGFAAANNLAMEKFASETEFFALVNPDAVLAPEWIAGALAYCQSLEGKRAGIVSSPLMGMDMNTLAPTGKWDTLGIFRQGSGRWYDRGQREPVANVPLPQEPYVPRAICGALMFIPRAVYHAVSDRHGFFDERFFTYKEDIDLSLRVAKAGYRLVMLPYLTAYHGRGWPKGRSGAPYWTRRLSARNDLRISAKHFPLMVPLYTAKYLFVITLERALYALQRSR